MTKKEMKESKKQPQKVEPADAISSFGEMEPEPFFEENSFDEMERFFASRFPGRWVEWQHPFCRGQSPSGRLAAPFAGKTPRVDLIEHDDKFVVKAELPGVDEKDLNITISNKVVMLEASTSKEEKEEKSNCYRREISRETYSRTFLVLPVNVKEDAAKATFKEGVLKLIIQKVEKNKIPNFGVDDNDT